MRVLHRTAAVVAAIAAIAVIAELVHAATSGNGIKVLNFVLFAVGAALAIALALFLWRDPRA
jgi:hypothetical protein